MGNLTLRPMNLSIIAQRPSSDLASTVINQDQDQTQILALEKKLLALPNEMQDKILEKLLEKLVKKLPLRHFLDLKTVSKFTKKLVDPILFSSFPADAFSSIDEMYEFLKAKPRYFPPWHFHLYEMVIARESKKGNILAIKALLEKPLEQRSTQDLVEVGLLDENQRKVIDRNPEHARYIISDAVILDLTQGVEPDFDSLLAVPADWIAGGIINAFNRLDEPESTNYFLAMVRSNLFLQSRNVGQVAATPLHKFAAIRFTDGIKILLSAGANINIRDGAGNTALHYGAIFNLPEVTEYLLNSGADPNLRNREGKSALYLAVANKFDAITRLLLEGRPNWLKLDIDLQNKSGWSPIHFAVSGNLPDFVRMLIAADANHNVQTKSGWSPLHYAVGGKYVELTQTLLAAEADINLQNESGWTALHIAVLLNSIDLVQVLIAIDEIDLTLKDNAGQTALSLANALGYIDIVKTLQLPHAGRPTPSLSWADKLLYYGNASASCSANSAPILPSQESNAVIENNHTQQHANSETPQEADSTQTLDPRDIEWSFYKLEENLREKAFPMSAASFKASMLGYLVIISASIGQWMTSPKEDEPRSPAFITLSSLNFVGCLMLLRSIPIDHRQSIIKREASLFKYPRYF